MNATETVQLSKHHGLGNDFLVAIEPELELTPADAIAWCDRRTGVGADGLIVSEGLADGVWSMVLYNADGSRAEISGNGIRCLAQAIGQHLGLELDAGAQHELKIDSDGGLRTVALTAADGGGGDVRQIQATVDMGPAKPGPAISDKWDSIGVEIKQQAAVDIGNPHLVVEVVSPVAIDLAAVGPVIEADYPEGVNIHMVSASDDSHAVVHTWERGAGMTQACGSGACVSAYQLNQWGLVGTQVDVSMPGGSATIELGESILLRGPAVFIADIEIAR